MSVSPNSALAMTLKEFFEKYNAVDYANYLQSIVWNVIFPLGLTFGALGGTAKILSKIWRILVPPPDSIRYNEAKTWYRQGYKLDALKEWSKLEAHGPAYLSRACHEIYVEWNPQGGLEILQQAKEQGVILSVEVTKQVQGMKMDAEAISKGNKVMIDMNARLAREELLGLVQ